MRNTTRKILIQLGLTPNYKGFHAIVEAVELFAANPTIPTMNIYRDVGKKLNVSPQNVERTIRTGNRVILERYNSELLDKIFGYAILSEGNIRNSDFIAALTMYVQEVTNV